MLAIAENRCAGSDTVIFPISHACNRGLTLKISMKDHVVAAVKRKHLFWLITWFGIEFAKVKQIVINMTY